MSGSEKASVSGKGVVFDMGKVLIDFDVHRAVARFAEKTSVPRERILPLLADEWVRGFSTGRMETEVFCRRAIDMLGLALDVPAFMDAWAGIFTPRPGMERLFDAVLRRARVGILSDTDPIHWAWLEANTPFVDAADAVVTSFEAGACKPDERMYAAVVEKMALPPEACLFVDDRERNVQGARAAGMEAFAYVSEAETRKRIEEFLGVDLEWA